MQVIISPKPNLAVAGDAAVVLVSQGGRTQALDGFPTFAHDFQPTVVAYLLFQVALGAQVDEFLAATVLEVQFVGPRPAWRTAAAQNATGLVLRQRIGDRLQRVRQATVDHWPVRVALQERHQDLHAHARDHHRAKAVARPTGCHPHPTAALVVVLVQPVPVKANFYPPVCVAMHVLTLGTGDRCGLTAADARFGVRDRWAVSGAPRRGGKSIAIALECLDIHHPLLQHLRLIAFVAHAGDQPQVIAGEVRVVAQLQEMPTAQSRLITATQRPMTVPLMTFQAPSGHLRTSQVARKPRWILIVLKCRGRSGLLLQTQ